MLEFYQNIPLGLDPVAFVIGSFSLRWYAISYIVGFFVIYLLLLYRISKGEIFSKMLSGDLLDVLLFMFFFSIIGGRIGFVLFYDFSYFAANPVAIISPFEKNTGAFVGIFGMSYYGALIGAIFALFIFCKKNKKSFWRLADFIAVAVPAGYFFGRIGNFLNGELYGRITTSSLGMHFPDGTLRFPSALGEAFFEGIILFIFLWNIRNKKYKPGKIGLYYIMGYAIARFFMEFFRQPDAQTELILNIFTLGQMLSLCAFIIALLFFLSLEKKRK
jgi:phosphatidylglycerol:prolipoprotein diacylglycerol transferase